MGHVTNKLFTSLEKRSALFIMSAGFLLIEVLGLIDYLTGPNLSFFIFYLLPVALGTWFAGRWAGITLSVLSAMAWSLADILSLASTRHYAIPYWNLTIELGFFFLASFMLTTLKKSFASERMMARMDFLTNAINYRYFTELAEREIQRFLRYHRVFSIAYIDLDNFKAVNDHEGHDAGNRLLQTVVATIRASMRETDSIARLGGDEFILLLPETTGDTALTALHKIREHLLAAMKGKGWPVTFSIGIVTFESAPQSVDHMVRLADAVMYEVKNSGKDRIACDVYNAPSQGRQRR